MVRTHPLARVFLLFSLVLYLALALWMTAHWTPLGDEPHYLLAAHSLVHDRDLDLANNYAQRDFQNFFDGEALDPHVKILPNGAQILNHDFGLPFALALPYALGGRTGAEIFLACIGALVAWQMWKLAFEVTQSALWSTLASGALAFTLPLLLYSALIYPEVIGALLFIWAARTILFRSPESIKQPRVILLALAVGILPWFSVRFIVLVSLLIVFVALAWRKERARVLTIFSIAAFSVSAYFLLNNVALAGTLPQRHPTALAGENITTLSLSSIARGIVGWWIDPQRGTFVLAPIYLIALAGIPRLLTNNFRKGILLISPLLVLIPLVALLGGFWIPLEVGARYFVAALPLLAAPLALALRAGFQFGAQWQRVAFGIFASVLFLLGAVNAALMLTDASYAYGSVVSAYSRAFGMDLSPFFAGLGHAHVIAPHNFPLPENPNVRVQELAGEAVWRAAPGSADTILSSYDLTELTMGNYALEFRASAIPNDSDAEVLNLDVFTAEGLPLLHSELRANELRADSLRDITLIFDNPNFDRWGFPLTLQVTTTGQAEIFLGAITFDPDTFLTWLRVGIWLASILVIILVLNFDFPRASRTRSSK